MLGSRRPSLLHETSHYLGPWHWGAGGSATAGRAAMGQVRGGDTPGARAGRRQEGHSQRGGPERATAPRCPGSSRVGLDSGLAAEEWGEGGGVGRGPLALGRTGAQFHTGRVEDDSERDFCARVTRGLRGSEVVMDFAGPGGQGRQRGLGGGRDLGQPERGVTQQGGLQDWLWQLEGQQWPGEHRAKRHLLWAAGGRWDGVGSWEATGVPLGSPERVGRGTKVGR